MSHQAQKLLFVAFFITLCYAQIDNSCISILCPVGTRCEKGMCLRVQSTPKKKICTLDFDLIAVRCTDRNYRCHKARSMPSCGFLTGGTKKDFENDCVPCLDTSVSFYYRVPCNRAPKICMQTEQCVNGNCVKLFAQQTLKDNQTCSSPKQCTKPGYTCASGRCVKLTDLVSQLSRMTNLNQINLN